MIVGIACMCQGLVKNKTGLIICRVFIGIFEAGYVPGCAYLMATYYKRHEFQKRFSGLWVAGLVAGAFGGLLAYALIHMNGLSGFEGWRWIFIIEGLATIAVAPVAKLLLTDWPDQARFLTAQDKLLLKARNAEDSGATDAARMDRLDADAWRRILTDWKILVGGLIYMGIATSGYATTLFIPTIVTSFGYSGVDSQVQSIPIWIAAIVVALITAYLTDRLKHRYGFIMFGVLVASIGYIILLCQGPPNAGLSRSVKYMAVFFVTMGTYIVQPVTIVWLANNLGGHYKKAIGLAFQLGFGNTGGIIASNIFVKTEAPRYFVGYGVSLAMMILCGIASTVFAIGLAVENKKRREGKRDDRLQLDPSILENMGDDDPRFRFAL